MVKPGSSVCWIHRRCVGRYIPAVREARFQARIEKNNFPKSAVSVWGSEKIFVRKLLQRRPKARRALHYPVSFDVDGQVYNGEGKGLHLDGLPGVDIAFDSGDFLMDIAQKQTLTLSNEAGEVMAIDLTDSYAALEAAVACQQNQ